MPHASAHADQGGDIVVKILQWPTPANWTSFGKDWNYRQKTQWRSNLSREIKQQLLMRLRQYPGVEVSNELVGTTQAVVCAPSETWDRLLDKANPVIPVDQIQIYDNDLIDGPDPVTSLAQ